MELPLISVIVPVYKVEKYLDRCVQSIVSQTYSNLEIILVDDGSPDNCPALCDYYADTDSRVKVIHKPNGGLSSARNAGIDIAKGQYYAFVDSDDWIEPDCYEKLYDLINRYHAKLAYAGRFDVDGDSGCETVGLCPEKEELISGEEMASRIFRWDHMDTAAWDKLYSADLFDKIRYPLNVIGEDLPITYRLALKAERCVVGNFPVYHYFHRPGSITTADISERDFFFPDTAIEIEQFISQSHPAILESAQYLKARALGWTVQMLDIAPSSVRKLYQCQSAQYRKLLRGMIPFVIRCPIFTPTQKRDYFLISFHLYRPMRWVFHFIKKSA